MKKRLAVMLTISVLVALVLIGRRQSQLKQAKPEDAIWAMLEAMRAGDAEAYLDCFDGQLRLSLEKTVQAMTAQKFSSYLRQVNSEIMGVVVSDIQPLDQDLTQIKVEFVYRDKNEVQQHKVRRVNRAWKICEVEGAKRVKTLIPYGTPVEDLEKQQ